MAWKLKSESDTEQVYAQRSGGRETGRYRYVFHDGRTIETGREGAAGRTRKARNPHTVRAAALAGAASLAVVGDLVWHALR